MMAFEGLLGGKAGYWLLTKLLKPPVPDSGFPVGSSSQEEQSRLETNWGNEIQSYLRDRLVLDYGCGYGQDVIAMARRGARCAIGLDVREDVLATARKLADETSLADRCTFVNAADLATVLSLHGMVDTIISMDAFEHFSDPKRVLQEMWKLARPGGVVLISFGPPWWHPYGSHLMFMGAPPWTHVVFKEQTIMKVRSLYRFDGAQRFEDVEGGLNRMTIRRFERLVRESGFQIDALNSVPIRGMARLANNRLGREFFTSIVRAHLVKP